METDSLRCKLLVYMYNNFDQFLQHTDVYCNILMLLQPGGRIRRVCCILNHAPVLSLPLEYNADDSYKKLDHDLQQNQFDWWTEENFGSFSQILDGPVTQEHLKTTDRTSRGIQQVWQTNYCCTIMIKDTKCIIWYTLLQSLTIRHACIHCLATCSTPALGIYL